MTVEYTMASSELLGSACKPDIASSAFLSQGVTSGPKNLSDKPSIPLPNPILFMIASKSSSGPFRTALTWVANNSLSCLNLLFKVFMLSRSLSIALLSFFQSFRSAIRFNLLSLARSVKRLNSSSSDSTLALFASLSSAFFHS